MKRLARSCLAGCLLLVLLPTLARAGPYEAQRKRGDQALARKHYGEAIASFGHLTQAFPKRYEAYQALGFAYFQAGQLESAIAQFRKALLLAPRNASVQGDLILAVDRLAIEKAQEFAFPEALKLLAFTEASYSTNRQTLVLHYRRGQIAFFMGDPETGLSLWKDVARRAPTSGTARFLSAYKSHQAGQLDQAQKDYQLAVQRLASDPVVLNYYGLLLADLGQFDQATVQFQKAQLNNPPYSGLYVNWARLLQRQGLLKEASHQVKRLASFPRSTSQAHLWLAALARAQGLVDVSQKELAQAALSQTDAVLLVTSAQPGWDVWLDQTYLGPAPVGTRLTAGFHRIKVQPVGRQPSLREFVAAPGQLSTAHADQLIELEQGPVSPPAPGAARPTR